MPSVNQTLNEEQRQREEYLKQKLEILEMVLKNRTWTYRFSIATAIIVVLCIVWALLLETAWWVFVVDFICLGLIVGRLRSQHRGIKWAKRELENVKRF